MSQSVNYSLFYRKVKHLRIEVEKGAVKLIVPQGYSLKIEDIIQKHENWIKKKLVQLEKIASSSEGLKLYNHKNLKEMVDGCVEEYSKILRVKPEKICFRWMKKRWGSCNKNEKKLIFNKQLKYLPGELVKYVVLHEMCHLLVKDHRKEYWLLIDRLDDGFKEKEKMLLSYKFKMENG